MEKVIYRLIFNRKKRLNARGEALIQVEAYYKQKKRYFSTRVYIKPGQWDERRRLIKNHPNEEALNWKIYSFIVDLERIELDVWQNKMVFSLQMLDLKTTTPFTSFLAFYQQEVFSGVMKDSTRKNHLSTLALLKSYKKSIAFSDLSYEFLCEFERCLSTKGYHKNTIAKHLKHIKRYVNLAINKNLFDIGQYPFRKFKIKTSVGMREYLTPEELKKLENIDTACLSVRGRKVLDAFLFSCYTGLRYSDLVALRPENKKVINNKVWLVCESVKTGVEIRLPLSVLFGGKALPLWDKYSRGSGPVFALPDNSNINKQLMKISAYVGLDKHITFHTGRHTYATILLYKGANITTVQKLLGHKSVRTTQIYSNIMDMTVVKDLEKIQ